MMNFAGFRPTLCEFLEQLNTATGRAVAEERHQFMEEFLRRFYEEWHGE